MHATEMYYKQVCNALLGGYRTPWNRRWKMKILFFGLKRSLFTAAMAVGLGFFSGAAFADDGGVDGNAVVSAACASFNQAKDYEKELKKHEDQAKKHADKAKKHADKAKKHEDELGHEAQAKKHEDEAKKHADKAKKYEDEAKKYEDEAKKHEDEAKKHEERAKDFANHKVPAGATSCKTTGGLPGFLPAAATSSTGAKVYREIRGK